jgi:hypothetical protein
MATRSGWRFENIDPDTGELLGTQLQALDAAGQPIGEPMDAATHQPAGQAPKLIKRPRKIRIGVVAPLSSLLGATDSPAELADRSGLIPGEILRQHIADTTSPDSADQVLFTRLLTDDDGRLVDVTELGRYPSTRLAEAINIRAGTCRFPAAPSPPTAATPTTTNHTRAVQPRQPTWTRSAEDTTAAKPSPGSPRSETTTASTGPCPTPNTTDAPTNRYPQDTRPEPQTRYRRVLQAFCGKPRLSPP